MRPGGSFSGSYNRSSTLSYIYCRAHSKSFNFLEKVSDSSCRFRYIGNYSVERFNPFFVPWMVGSLVYLQVLRGFKTALDFKRRKIRIFDVISFVLV